MHMTWKESEMVKETKAQLMDLSGNKNNVDSK